MSQSAPNIGFAKRLDAFTQSVALIGFGGLVVVALLTFYDGVARYLGVPRLSGFSDYGELVYPIVIASCFPAGLLRQSNITVRVMNEFVGERISMFFEAFAALLVLAFFTVLSWQFIELAMKYTSAGRTTRTIEMQLAPWWWIATTIMALCVPVQIYVCWSWINAAITGRTPALKSLGSGKTLDPA